MEFGKHLKFCQNKKIPGGLRRPAMTLKQVEMEGEKFLYRVIVKSEKGIRALIDHIRFFMKIKGEGEEIEVIIRKMRDS